MIRKAIFSVVLLVLTVTVSQAQQSQVLYYMNLSQNHLLNPAMRPSNSLYIGLPGISGINLNINNNFVNFSDIFSNDPSSDSVFTFLHPASGFDVNDFLGKIKEQNSIEPQATIQLFGLGFAAGKDSYIFFDINERMEGNAVIPKDLFELAFNGNAGFAGRSINLSTLRADARYYREIGLGFSKQFTNRLRVGVKGKYLAGITAFSMKNKAFAIEVGKDYSHTIDADMSFNISGPVGVSLTEDNFLDTIGIDKDRLESASEVIRFIRGAGNRGLGFDLGAVYDVTDRISVSAALTDFGFIRWKKDVTNLRSQGRYVFNGIDMTDVINGEKTFDEASDEIIDSLKKSFAIAKTGDPFTTFLPVGLTLGGSYKVTNFFSMGLLSYSRIIGKQVRESVTISANLNLSNAFSTSLSYTASNHRYDNLGFGIAFRPGIFQFYLLTDRLPVTWNRIITGGENGNKGSTVILPSNWNTIQLRLGMNLVFGNRTKKKSDKPSVTLETI